MRQPLNLSHLQHTITAPYCNIFLYSKHKLVNRWKIQINKLFIIGFTIQQAYVPFSDACMPHNIEFYDGIKDGTLLERFCGLLGVEMVITRQNHATIIFQVYTDTLPGDLNMEVTYHALDKNSAYRYNSAEACLPTTWKANILPSLIFVFNKIFQFIWYISNAFVFAEKLMYTGARSVQRVKFDGVRIRPTEFFMKIYCRSVTSLLIYPGLLSIKYLNIYKPINVAQCHSKGIIVDQILAVHPYSTILIIAKYPLEDRYANITFYTRESIGKSATSKVTNTKELPKWPHTKSLMHHGRFNTDTEYTPYRNVANFIRFTFFEYLGLQTTRQPWAIRTIYPDVQNFSPGNALIVVFMIACSCSVDVHHANMIYWW